MCRLPLLGLALMTLPLAACGSGSQPQLADALGVMAVLRGDKSKEADAKAAAILPVVAVPKTFGIDGVEVRFGPGVRFPSNDLDGKTPEQQAAKVKASLEQALAAGVTGLPGGPTRARLVVVLTEVDVASGAARVIGQQGSRLKGDVQIVDRRSKALIVALPGIAVKDEAVEAKLGKKKSEVLDFALAAVVNAASADKTFEIVAALFADEVKSRLVH